MAKQTWKAGNMLYPLPAVMVSVADREGKANIITVAWAGTVCTNPPMVSISVRPERYSYHMLEETGEFVINLTCEKLVYAADYCGVKSGRDVDKFREMKLKKESSKYVKAPMIAESPVNIECRVVKKEELGSHHLFLAEVLAVHVDEAYLDERGRFALEMADPVVYSHGQYFGLGDVLGSFGYSIRRKENGGAKKGRSGREEAGGRKKTATSRRTEVSGGKKTAASKRTEVPGGKKTAASRQTEVPGGKKTAASRQTEVSGGKKTAASKRTEVSGGKKTAASRQTEVSGGKAEKKGKARRKNSKKRLTTK